MNIKDDNLLYMVETLAGYEPSDIDDDDFEVVFQTTDGCDASSTQSVVDIAAQAVELIKRQDERIKKLELALTTISEWNSLSLDYRVNYGSNGQREHYRGVAAVALNEVVAELTTQGESGFFDDDGKPIREGDKIKSSFGIPTIQIIADVVIEDGVFMAINPTAYPKRISLEDFIKHLGQVWIVEED